MCTANQLKSKTSEEIAKATGGLGIAILNGHYKMQKISEIEELIKSISKLPDSDQVCNSYYFKIINSKEIMMPMLKSLKDL